MSAFTIIAAPRNDRVHRHESNPKQHAGDDAAKKKVPDRCVRYQRVEYHRDRRRDDRSDDGGRRRDRAGIGHRVAAVFRHHPNDDAPDADGVGDRRARHPRKDHVGDNVDVAKTAAKAPD